MVEEFGWICAEEPHAERLISRGLQKDLSERGNVVCLHGNDVFFADEKINLTRPDGARRTVKYREKQNHEDVARPQNELLSLERRQAFLEIKIEKTKTTPEGAQLLLAGAGHLDPRYSRALKVSDG